MIRISAAAKQNHNMADLTPIAIYPQGQGYLMGTSRLGVVEM